MGIIDPLREEKIAIVEAFGLSADDVPEDGLYIGPETVTITEYQPKSIHKFIEHEFSGKAATDSQIEAVNAYLQKCRMKGSWPAAPYPARLAKEQP